MYFMFKVIFSCVYVCVGGGDTHTIKGQAGWSNQGKLLGMSHRVIEVWEIRCISTMDGQKAKYLCAYNLYLLIGMLMVLSYTSCLKSGS